MTAICLEVLGSGMSSSEGQLGVNNEGRKQWAGGNGGDGNTDKDTDSLTASQEEINFKWCNLSFIKFLCRRI